MRSSIAFARCAVLRPDSPPPIGPASTTMTFLPAFDSKYAVDSPAMPAPTIHTSVRALPPSDGNEGTSNVPIQIDAVSPPGFVLCSRMRRKGSGGDDESSGAEMQGAHHRCVEYRPLPPGTRAVEASA